MTLARLSIYALSALMWPMIAQAVPQPALQTDKFHITEAERMACRDDAVNLCSDAYPSEDLMLVCMKSKREQLSEGCRTTFDSGLKRRHMPLN